VKCVKIALTAVAILVFGVVGFRATTDGLYWAKLTRHQEGEISSLKRRLADLQAERQQFLQGREVLEKQGEELQSLKEENERVRETVAQLQSAQAAR